MATVLQHPFGTTAFGDFLRTARERRGLTLQQIANETKIPRHLLESLEHGDLGAAPAGMYQRAEIRAYAKAVGLDQTLALSELERALATREFTSEEHPGVERETDGRRHRPYLILALVMAVAVIASAAWYGGMMTLASGERARTDRATQQAARRAAAVPVAQQGAAGGTEADRGAATSPPQLSVTPGAEAATAQPSALLAAKENATATPALPAAALVTELVVVTDPPGARVTVDGIGRGTTPLTIRYLPAGEKRVRVLKAGFPAQERTVRLAPAREATTVVIPLQATTQ